MAVSYSNIISADAVVSEIETLNEWRTGLLRQRFYPDVLTTGLDDAAAPPTTLLPWCQQEVKRGTIDAKIVDRLAQSFADLTTLSKEIAATAAGPLPLALYDRLSIGFDSYISQVRRLHQDLADAAGAVDTLTGLRTVSGLRAELKREQDRFDRKGTPYNVACIGLDNVGDLSSRYNRRQMDSVYAAIGGLIASSLRSFDDAYYLGGGEYIIILKHIEFMDSCAVMDRLRHQVEDNPVLMAGGDKVQLTVSLGIAEAHQHESSEKAIDNAKTAMLNAKAKGGNCVVEFHEKSALTLYAGEFKRS